MENNTVSFDLCHLFYDCVFLLLVSNSFLMSQSIMEEECPVALTAEHLVYFGLWLNTVSFSFLCLLLVLVWTESWIR